MIKFHENAPFLFYRLNHDLHSSLVRVRQEVIKFHENAPFLFYRLNHD